LKINNHEVGTFTGACGIIGVIIGTIMFVTSTFGEWYADFDVEPVGLITGILTLIVFLLPFVISVFIGGGVGGIIGILIGIGVSYFFTAMYNAFMSVCKYFKKRYDIKKETRKLHQDMKSIDILAKRRKDILKLNIGEGKEIILESNLVRLLSTVQKSQPDIKILEDKIEEKRALVDELQDIDNKLNELEKKLRKIGNSKKADYYARQIEQGRERG
jgi:hypothetical protein